METHHLMLQDVLLLMIMQDHLVTVGILHLVLVAVTQVCLYLYGDGWDSCDADSVVFPLVCERKVQVVQPSSKAQEKRYLKPIRRCPFCRLNFVEKLSRHIMKVHKSIKRVSDAMKLPKKEMLDVFAIFKKEGILQVNKEQMKTELPSYQRERITASEDQLVVCGICSGFYSKKCFKKHKQRCQGDSHSEACSVPLSLMLSQSNTSNTSDTFRREILCKFRENEIGETARTDPVIVTVGNRLWEKGQSKKDKTTEVRKSVMSDMRRLASLYIIFQEQHKMHSITPLDSNTAADMFYRKNFEVLREAILLYTTHLDSAELKSGLKSAVYYLVKKACKIIKATHLVAGRDEEATEIDKFAAVLGLNYEFLFGDAVYQINKNRQKNLRKPGELPLETDVKKIRIHTIGKVREMVSDPYLIWDSHNFNILRDLTVARLTLFNARRGGEPSRLKLAEWKEAETDSWIDKQRAERLEDPLEKRLLDNIKVTYQTGKGNNHLVPVLFPSDTVEALKKLTNDEVRKSAGVRDDNTYVFACVNGSATHVTGWHALSKICANADISCKSRLTATKNRHRISTL